MKKTIGFLLLLAGFYMSATAQTKVRLTVNNPSGFDRKEELVSFSWTRITAKYPQIDTANFQVIDEASNTALPFQLERRGQAGVQNLLVQVNVKAKGRVKLALVDGKPGAVVTKTYGRYVPERFDDFTWENDKVAFRMYGKALEGRKDNAFGTDVWVKRTNKMIINEWYKSGDYHKDHGDGLDYYSVGLTLGAGDIAPLLKDSIIFSKNYHHWKMLDNGPLRTTFELGYDAWDVGGRSVKVTKTISLDAGSQMNRIEALYTYTGADLPLVVGIVKRKEPGTVLADQKQGVVGYREPQHGADGTTGVGTIVLDKAVKTGADKTHLLTYTSARNNQPVVYYNGAAWSKGGDIAHAEAWFNYLFKFRKQLDQPLNVKIQ